MIAIDANQIEKVACAFFTHIAFAEEMAIAPDQYGEPPTKAWILDTNTECLRATQAPDWVGKI
jgi:hypothetical protein